MIRKTILLLLTVSLSAQCPLCNTGSAAATTSSQVGSSSISNIGINSVKMDMNSVIGLNPKQFQGVLSYSQSNLTMNQINDQIPNQIHKTRIVTFSAGLGVTRMLSLWSQLPIYSFNSKPWQLGDIGLGIKINPMKLNHSGSGPILFFNQGIVIPTNNNSVLTDSIFGLTAADQFLSRSMIEMWTRSDNEVIFGLLASADFLIKNNPFQDLENNIYQLAFYSVDQRYKNKKITPIGSIIYRYDPLNNPHLNEPWFLQLMGAIDLQLQNGYGITVSVSSPIIIGFEGSDINQVNINLDFRWLSKQNNKNKELGNINE